MLVIGLYVLLSLLAICRGESVRTSYNYDDLNSRSKFAERIQAFLDSENSSRISLSCGAHYGRYLQGLFSGKEEDRWALQMFDARSKLPSGLMNGNIADLGSFDECLNINAKLPRLLGDIHGKYCLGSIPLTLESSQRSVSTIRELLLFDPALDLANPETRSAQSISLQFATCVPHTCSAKDMEQIFFYLGMKFSEELCQTQSTQPELDGGSIAMICFLGLILWIMVASTGYDVTLYYLEKKPHHPLLIAFSVLTNGKKILATSNAPNQISCLHGIRVISTMWVILGHRYSIQAVFPIRNYLDAFKWMENPANMFVAGATVAVDTFFVMSGLVIAYSFMGAITKGVKFNVPLYYIHRYIRLTPVLIVVVVTHLTLLRHFGSGPLWPQRTQADLISNCEKYWWKALLYIQNFGSTGVCVPQSWYLSVDTQLFLLSPIILIPLAKWPKITLSMTGFLCVCSMIACFLVSWFFNIEQNVMLNADPIKRSDYLLKYYYATHTRAGPWFIGIILGYIVFMFKQRRTKLNINKVETFNKILSSINTEKAEIEDKKSKIVIFMWITSLAVLATCVFIGHDLLFEESDKLISSLYLALMRPIWAVALSSVIFLCVIGYGGPINWLLSMPVFQVVSKLTFTLYLAHYTVIHITTGSMRVAPIFSNSQMLYVFWGDFVYTLLVALVLTLAFESPIITLEKVLFGKSKKAAARPQTTEVYTPKPVETV